METMEYKASRSKAVIAPKPEVKILEPNTDKSNQHPWIPPCNVEQHHEEEIQHIEDGACGVDRFKTNKEEKHKTGHIS